MDQAMNVNQIPPPEPSVTPCTCAMLRRTARRITRIYDQALRPAGLRLNQFSILANIARDGGLSITDLADQLEMERTTLTRNLHPLVRAGWVLIATSRDRRQRSVGLTQSGRALYEQALPLWQIAERTLREDLGRDQTEQLRSLLDQTVQRGGNPTKS